MNQKDLTKTILNLKKPFGFHGLYKNNLALQVLTLSTRGSTFDVRIRRLKSIHVLKGTNV